MSTREPSVLDPIDEVIIGGKVLEMGGHADGIWGHLTLRDPDGRGAWIKAYGYSFDEVPRSAVLLVGWDNKVIEGEGRAPIESPLHLEIMAARNDVGAVVHTHPPHALAFASRNQPLRPISHDACLFTPPDVVRYTATGDLISTLDLGKDLAGVLGERNACFIPHHGIVTVGSGAADAVVTAVFLERACQIQLLAGLPATWSSESEALQKRERIWSSSQLAAQYACLVRRLDRSNLLLS